MFKQKKFLSNKLSPCLKKIDFSFFAFPLRVAWRTKCDIKIKNKGIDMKNQNCKRVLFTLLGLSVVYSAFLYIFYAGTIKEARQNLKPLPFYTTKVNAEHLVAHAGGAIDNTIYTGAKEAYENSIKAGMNFIEIDFQETSDGHFVAVHDWETFRKLTNRTGDKPLSYEEVMSSKILGKYTPMDEKTIIDLMKKYPHVTMITDKTRNVKKLAETFPFHDRMIVQTFHLSDYLKALKYGLPYPTLRLKGGRKGIPFAYKKLIEIFNVKAVILGELSFNKNKDFIKKLHKKGVLIILYGNPLYQIVDHPEQVKSYAGKYVDLFDSDYMQHL